MSRWRVEPGSSQIVVQVKSATSTCSSNDDFNKHVAVQLSLPPPRRCYRPNDRQAKRGDTHSLSIRGSYTHQSALAICRWQSVVRRLGQLSQCHVLHSKSKQSSANQNNSKGDPFLVGGNTNDQSGKWNFLEYVDSFVSNTPYVCPT